MPKINVYLPSDLAERVKAQNLPVSAICQRALWEVVEPHGAESAEKPTDPQLACLAYYRDRAERPFLGSLARQHLASNSQWSVERACLRRGWLHAGRQRGLAFNEIIPKITDEGRRVLAEHS